MAINGTWIAASVAAGAGVASVAQGMDSSRKADNKANDAKLAAEESDRVTASNANARIKMQRQAARDSSLLTGGAGGGKSTLGVG